MVGVLKFCPECRKENNEPWFGYYPFMSEDATCNTHSIQMKTIDISTDDYMTILRISHDVTFLEAMIQLKQDNIIEYESRMSQFRNQVEQQKQIKEQEETKPTCPHCGSKNIQLGTRGFSLITGFIGANNPQYYCLNCHHKWKPNSLSEAVTRAWNGK